MTLRLSARGQAAIAVPCALGLTAVMLVRPAGGTALIAGMVVLLALIVAFSHPMLIFGAAIATLVAIPMTSVPAATILILHPGLILIWVLVAALFAQEMLDGSSLRLSSLDLLATLLLIALSLTFAARTRTQIELGRTVFLWAGPFLAGRLLVARHGARGLLRAFVFGALALVPLAVIESVSGSNVFLSFPRSAYAAPDFLQSVTRLGGSRAQTSLGHPIALSMLLATSCVLAVGLAMTADRWRRAGWSAAAIVLAAAQFTTLSRTGWLVVVVGLVLIVLAVPRTLSTPSRLFGVLAVAGVATALVTIGPARALIFPTPTEPGGAEVQRSAQYRKDLIGFALSPGILLPFGHPEKVSGPRGNASIDNEYVYFGLLWGVVPLLVLGLFPVLMLVGLLGVRHDAVATALVAAVVANFVALTGVALITQQQVFVWLIVGAGTAVVAARQGGGRFRVAR